MTRKRNWIRAVAALVAITAIVPTTSSPALAESETKSQSTTPSPSLSGFDDYLPHLGYWSGALGLNYMNNLQSTSSANAGGSKSTNSLMRETMKITNSGLYILNPRLLTGNMELDLGFDQDKSGGSGGSTVTNGNVIGYGLDATILGEKPYVSSVFANRGQTHVIQPFGGTMAGLNENRGALFQLRQDSILNDWGFPWFESNLRIQENHSVNTTTSFGNTQSSDEKRRMIDFNASKGFETADLGFNYQFDDMTNATFREGNFQSHAAGLNYSVDFGPTLNRRFDSISNYLSRNGTSPSQRISNSEHLHVDHYQNLKTDYLYGISILKSGDISTTAQNGAFSVAHQLYKNLNTSAGIDGSHSTLPGGSTTSYGGHLGEGYHHNLPGKGNISISASGSYSVTSNALSASTISVLDEIHNAPTFGAGVGFLLDHSFAVAASIVVFNVRGGGRILLTAGVDYNVIIENNQIKIVPLAGSLLISPGDPLAVSYDYLVDANLKYASKASGYGMAVNYNWITAAYTHRQSTQTPLSVSSSLFLRSTRQDTVRLDLRGTLLEMEANASMDISKFESTDIFYEQDTLTSSLIREIQSNMRMVIGMNAIESKYTVPDQHQNSTLSVHSSLNWYTYSGWNNSATINWSTYKDTGAPAETLVQGIARSSITLGQLSLSANVALGEWHRSDRTSTNRSFFISAVRQFR